MIIQLEHAVSDDDCRRLTAMYDCRAALTNARDYTGHPVVYWEQLRELPAAVEIVSPLVENCLCTLGELLPAAGPLYPVIEGECLSAVVMRDFKAGEKK